MTSTSWRKVATFGRLLVREASPHDGEAWSSAKRAELEVFAEPNGWADDADLAAGEVLAYAPYEDRSQIFTVSPRHRPDEVVGVARMIWGRTGGELEDFLVPAAHRLDPQWQWFLRLAGTQRIAEWATLGTRSRTPHAMYALWSFLYQESRGRGVDYWIQSLVAPVLDAYRETFRMPLLTIGESEVVVGALSIPTVLPLEEIAVGAFVAWDPQLKHRLVGDWMDRPRIGPPMIDLREPIDLRQPRDRVEERSTERPTG